MLTTRQAAQKLGIGTKTLSRYIALNKVPPPKVIKLGRFVVHAWTEVEVEAVRRLLPKIANGRKTRYQKLREKQKAPAAASPTQRAKTTRAGAPGPVPHQKRTPKKKTQPRAAALPKKRKPKKK